MKKSFLAIIMLQFFAMGICHAQTAQPDHYNLKPPPPNIVVDGDLKEWGDTLSFYSPEEHLTYQIANSKDTLYLAVKIYDRTEMARVLSAGLTFSINPKGKNKEAFSTTYPVNVGSSPLFKSSTDNETAITQDDRDELLRERLTTLRGIKMVGFKDVEDDMITTSNTYGFQAIVNYDAAGDMVYEEAIPLKFFHADNIKDAWAFNIKINGVQRPAKPAGENSQGEGGQGGGRSGGMGGGGGGRHVGGGGRHGGGGNSYTDGGETAKTIDFWGKIFLAK